MLSVQFVDFVCHRLTLVNFRIGEISSGYILQPAAVALLWSELSPSHCLEMLAPLQPCLSPWRLLITKSSNVHVQKAPFNTEDRCLNSGGKFPEITRRNAPEDISSGVIFSTACIKTSLPSQTTPSRRKVESVPGYKDVGDSKGRPDMEIKDKT